jgi:hypothetical protein
MLLIEPVFKRIAELFSDDNHDACVGLPSTDDLKVALNSARSSETVRQGSEAVELDATSTAKLGISHSSPFPQEPNRIVAFDNQDNTENEKTGDITPAIDTHARAEITNKDSEGVIIDESTDQGPRKNRTRRDRSSGRDNVGKDVEIERKSAETTVEEQPQDPNIVDWDGLDDPANPHNWSNALKVVNVGLVCGVGFVTQLASCK